MADKSISELTAASAVNPSDLFVLEQNATAKKLTGQTLENWLVSFADGHGGIQSISKTSTSGLVDTYTITFADTTSSTFTVTNGAKGDTGAASYVHIKFAAKQPTANSDMSNTPDKWMGIYSGISATAPTSYSSYTWYEIKGETGDPAELLSSTVTYQIGGSTVPSGIWTNEVPTVLPGDYLWVRTVMVFSGGKQVISYYCARQGIDGSGSPSDELPNPDGTASAGTSTAFSRADHVHPKDEVKTLTVGTSTTADIQYNADAITALNRYYARQIGNIIIFSFVATNAQTTPNQPLFTFSQVPGAQVDFVVLSSVDGVVNGAVKPSGVIDINSRVSPGTIRGEVTWVIED